MSLLALTAALLSLLWRYETLFRSPGCAPHWPTILPVVLIACLCAVMVQDARARLGKLRIARVWLLVAATLWLTAMVHATLAREAIARACTWP